MQGTRVGATVKVFKFAEAVFLLPFGIMIVALTTSPPTVTSFMAITATLGFFLMLPATDGSAHGYNIRKNCARACLTALLFDNELPDRQLQESSKDN